MNIQRLIEAVEHDQETHAWLTAALDRWRDGEPLEYALGLAGPRAIKSRNAALCRAADVIDPAGDLSTWRRAGRVRKALRYFNGRSDGSILSETIAEIARIESETGIRPVRCQRSIYEIIR